jgi:hypothetical protein
MKFAIGATYTQGQARALTLPRLLGDGPRAVVLDRAVVHAPLRPREHARPAARAHARISHANAGACDSRTNQRRKQEEEKPTQITSARARAHDNAEPAVLTPIRAP